MNPAIKEILHYVIDHPEMTTPEAVDDYFSHIIWSLEKHEWMKLSDRERQHFIAQLDAAKERPPKGP